MRRGGRAPARRGFRAVRLGHPVQRAAHAARTAVEDVGVDHRGGHVLVVQLLLHRPDAIAGLDEVRGKRMSQRVAGRGLVETTAPHRPLHRTLQHGFIRVMSTLPPLHGSMLHVQAGNAYCHIHFARGARVFARQRIRQTRGRSGRSRDSKFIPEAYLPASSSPCARDALQRIASSRRSRHCCPCRDAR